MKLNALKLFLIALAIFGGIALAFGQTTSFENGRKYHVEASNDSIHFESIGTIYSGGCISEVSFTNFIVKLDLVSYKYYQLREITQANNAEYYGDVVYIYVKKE